MTPITLITLRFLADRTRDPVTGRIRSVDLREISEPMRQAIIDLGMMEPPLVEVDADQVFLNGHGHQYLHELDAPTGISSQHSREYWKVMDRRFGRRL